MILKLKVINGKNFRNVLEACPSARLCEGSEALYRRCIAGESGLPLTLKVRAPQDYFRLVNYYLGDC